MKRTSLSTALVLAAALTLPSAAAAHGINGHIWVTDGGIELMADCEFASALLGDPELREAIQIGAAFPDSGYALDEGREYGETAHWEPFVEAFIRYMRTTYKPPYDTFEEKKLIAFLMGFASHGMEDELFDTIFLRKSLEAEGTDQDLLDPGTDFMLIADGKTKLHPAIFLPATDLLAVFADPDVDVDVDEKTMQTGMLTVHTVVIGLVEQDESIDDKYRPQLPWTAEHYLDPKQPGSLAWEKSVIGPYLDAIWHRLHEDYRTEDTVVQTVPAAGERLLSTDHTSVDSWINVVFGTGVWNRSLTPANVKLLGPNGSPVGFDIAFTRWGNAGSDGRMVQLRPQADLQADARYTVVLSKDIELMGGRTLGEEIRIDFKTACNGACAALEVPEAAGYCPAVSDITAPAQKAATKEASGGCHAGSAAPVWLLFALLPLLASYRRSRP